MLLGDNHGSGLDCGGDDCLGVERLDGRHIDDLGTDSIGFKSLGSLKGLPNHVPGGEDGDILAFVQDVSLSDFERLVRSEVGDLRTAETQIDRAVIFGCGDRRVLCLRPVARVDHNHSRKSAHQGDVLHCLVGGTVLTEGDSGVRGCDLDVGLAVADLHSDLVVNTSGDELGERSGERNLAGEGHA